MYTLSFTNRFEKDLKLIKKRSLNDFQLIYDFLKNELSIKGAEGLPSKFRAHKLSGNYKGNWECHIKGDLLITIPTCSKIAKFIWIYNCTLIG